MQADSRCRASSSCWLWAQLPSTGSLPSWQCHPAARQGSRLLQWSGHEQQPQAIRPRCRVPRWPQRWAGPRRAVRRRSFAPAQLAAWHGGARAWRPHVAAGWWPAVQRAWPRRRRLRLAWSWRLPPRCSRGRSPPWRQRPCLSWTWRPWCTGPRSLPRPVQLWPRSQCLPRAAEQHGHAWRVALGTPALAGGPRRGPQAGRPVLPTGKWGPGSCRRCSQRPLWSRPLTPAASAERSRPACARGALSSPAACVRSRRPPAAASMINLASMLNYTLKWAGCIATALRLPQLLPDRRGVARP